MKAYFSFMLLLMSFTAVAGEQVVPLSMGQTTDALTGQVERTITGVTDKYVIVLAKAHGIPIMVVHSIDKLAVFDHPIDGQCRWLLTGSEARTTRCQNNFTELMYLSPSWMSRLGEGHSLRLEVRTSKGTDVLVLDTKRMRDLFAQL